MSIKRILDNMNYGLAPESPDEVKNWLLKHNSSFGHFIGGAPVSYTHLTLPTSDLV